MSEEAAREAIEQAYLNQGEEAAGLNRFELFAYASDIPADVDEDDALCIAADVLENPPETDGSQNSAPSTGQWFEVGFEGSGATVFPPEHQRHDNWMTHRGNKLPYAPWTDHDAPAPCSKQDHTTAADCDCSARYKWGWEQNLRPFDQAVMCLDDSQIEGLVYIQREDDPFVFVDGDDVRCPETGDVHPAFLAILSHLGMTYTDISLSGAGVHAYYRGDLPDGETTAAWNIDDEPWGANDDLPAIEFYSGKHVCVTTGQHVEDTPVEVRPWNSEVVWTLLEANDQFTENVTPSIDVEFSEPNSESEDESDGTTPEDCIRALNRLNAARVAGDTIVREWTDGSGRGMGFLPTWGNSDDGGTANFVDENFWTDTGHNGGSGGPIEMALIDLNELNNRNSEVGYASGSDFWTGYEHLRDLGYNLPEPPYAGDDNGGSSPDYYDAPLGEYVDGDPWSDPDAMLEACLKARADGVVSEDVDPPTLALMPIVRELLGAENVGEETKEMAKEVYLNELSDGDFEDGELAV